VGEWIRGYEDIPPNLVAAPLSVLVQPHPMDGAEQGRNVPSAGHALPSPSFLPVPSIDHRHGNIPDEQKAALEETDTPANGPRPVFYMSTARGLSEGKVISLHIFEPRYKVLVQEALACADRSFLWTSQRPRPGMEGWLLQILSASVEDDGSADIKACATRGVRLSDVTARDAMTFEEDDESTLYWARWAGDEALAVGAGGP
jgi:hypothetical protein